MSPTSTLTHVALRRAMHLALHAAATAPVTSPNPRVGCTILDGAGNPLATGSHQGVGTPHAEAAALAVAGAAGISVRGKTAVVTLEPCARQGRTPPCADALQAAGIARVIYLVADPTDFGGGAAQLRAAGVDVLGPQELSGDAGAGTGGPGPGADAGAGAGDFGVGAFDAELRLAQRLLRPWLTAVAKSRPYVVAKFATTLDGRIAAADGSSRWITGPQAREHVHQVRAEVDGILVGTETVLADDPSLTVRNVEDASDAAGAQHRDGREYQPRRIILGRREVPAAARVRGLGGELVHLQTHDVGAALRELFDRGLRHIVVEGGAQVLAAFFRAGLVDEIHHYLAPALLGGGASAVADFGVTNISEATRWRRHELLELGPDLLQVLTPLDSEYAAAVPGTWHVTT